MTRNNLTDFYNNFLIGTFRDGLIALLRFYSILNLTAVKFPFHLRAVHHELPHYIESFQAEVEVVGWFTPV